MRRLGLFAASVAFTMPLTGCSADPTTSDEYRALEARFAGVQAERDALLGELYAVESAEQAESEAFAGDWPEVENAGYEGLITITPVEWQITLDDEGPGVHTAYMIVDTRPVTPADVGRVSGRLVWDDVEVDLCGLSIRDVGDGFVRVGDIFQTTEGCGSNPAAMQEAFDQYGVVVKGCLAIGFHLFQVEYCALLTPITLTLTPVEWEIVLDNRGEGVHTIHMTVDGRPLTADLVQDVSARLVWEEVEVDLCGFNWDVGDAFLLIGDIFHTNEGCYEGDTAMQDAFDSRGLPETACVAVRVDDVDHEYCAPLE